MMAPDEPCRYDAPMIGEPEGREIAAIPKWGEPETEWSQHVPNTLSNGFGVVDGLGRTIPGLTVDMDVFISPKLGIRKFVFTVFRKERRSIKERAYQMEVNHTPGLNPTEHAYSHEHFGEPRYQADQTWAYADFPKAVARFCDMANLTLKPELSHYEEFTLKS